jgi:transcription antitermination factor NusA-like protein
VTLRMIIPGKEIGVIIGKGGETINQIRQDSQAKIFITDASVPERVITVTGNEQGVCSAYELMCCKLEAGEDGNQTKNLNLRLVVPAAQCGSIIGKGGSKVKEIRDTTHASINVAQDLLPGSNERCVTVAGARSKCVQAINIIVSIVVAKPLQGAVVQYKPNFPQMPGFHGPAPPMDARRGGPPDPRMGGMGMGGGPPMPNNPLAALAMTARNHMRRAGSSGEEASHNMTISNDLIGVIIGKGGSKIHEIRHMSGAMIQISKNEKGDDGEENKDRSITITGSPESVTLAKNLINMTLELHQLDRHEENLEDERPRRGGYDPRYESRGAPQHEELMKAINTITQYGMGAAAATYMGGAPAGYGGPAGAAGGMRGGGRPQNGGPRGGGGHRDDRNGAGGAGQVRNKFSPY